MNNSATSQYDEFRQIRKDYGSAAEFAIYDATHADFRAFSCGQDLRSRARRSMQVSQAIILSLCQKSRHPSPLTDVARLLLQLLSVRAGIDTFDLAAYADPMKAIANSATGDDT